MNFMPNMEEYLKQHDLVYEVAPIDWDCGIPLANGEIGALIWGDGNPLKITLDKYDTWELRTATPTDPRHNYAGLRKLIEEKRFEEARRVFLDLGRFSGSEEVYPTRIPLPRVELSFTKPIDGFNARLSIFDGVASGSFATGNERIDWRIFVHSNKNLLTIELQYTGNTRLKDVRIRLDHLNDRAKNALKRWGYPEPIFGTNGECMWLKQEFPGENAAGGGYVVVWRRFEENRSKEIIYISVLSFNDSPEPINAACNIIDEAIKIGITNLLESHRGFWKTFWTKSFVSLPDSRLENLFYVEMYKLACCSKGTYPCPLQGLWSEDGILPPWSGDYHLDMNVEETYWPVYASNHLDLGKPLYEQFWKNLPRFKRMCKDFFGFEGAWSRCEMAIDGTIIYGYYTTNFWPGNGAWLAHHYWLHWLYSQDEKFLRERAYPTMKAYMQTYMNLLELQDDGLLHIPLSNSPEWGENMPEAWGSDTTCDIAFARWLAGSLLDAVKILNINDPDTQRWREVLEKLTDYPQDENGLQIYKGQPLTHSHRHHSHLIPIHPLGILNVEGSDKERKLISISIRTWLLRGTGEWGGWPFSWASLIASRVKLPNMAWHMLQTFFYFIKPNTFHMNGDYRRFGVCAGTGSVVTLEGGFCAAAATLEMLLQSWNGCIRVFPTVPEFWKDAYFHMLRAEGAFLVTSKLKDRRVEFVMVESEAGRKCKMLNPFGEGKVSIVDLEANKQLILEGKHLEFETVIGRKYLLTPLEKPISEEEFNYISFERKSSEVNWFGVKKIPKF